VPEGKRTAQDPTAADVLLANQLYYAVEAQEYDQKNHVSNPAIRRYYDRVLDRFVFEGRSEAEIRRWRVCDVGCGTGFLEMFVADRVHSIVAFDATYRMLEHARAKFVGARVTWVQADAQALPIGRPVFDLVCSNAMLHHVYDFEDVLVSMISMLKPGGKLLLGYEPNAIPYRVFWPLLKVVAKIVPEHRNRDAIRNASGEQTHPRLKDVDIHELSEFHIFHGTGRRGIQPFRLQEFLSRHGIVDSRVLFSSVHQFALLSDSGIPMPVHKLPDWLFRLSGRLSLSFSLTGADGGQVN
jgi:2-polyprenyl-3-methyl-5-hydroxy-6-metoxy-1,4-benzoquinol methylase